MYVPSNPGIEFLLTQMRNPALPLHHRIAIAGKLLEILPPEMEMARWDNLAPEDRVTIVIGGLPELPVT
jgi:hypothetical protein